VKVKRKGRSSARYGQSGSLPRLEEGRLRRWAPRKKEKNEIASLK